MSDLEQLVTLLTAALQKSQSTDLGLHFDNFKEDEETWSTFIERLENYFSLRELSGESDTVLQKKRELLLHTIGSQTLQLLTNLTSPDKPSQKSYKELVKLLQEHLSPKPSEIAEQNKFCKRIQREGETISSFVTDLKKLTKDCNFVCPHCETSTIDVHLRQQFISGVRSSILLERLLQLKPPANKFQNCVEVAVAMESAQKESREIQNYTSTVHRVQINKNNKIQNRNNGSKTENIKSSNFTTKCFRCGNSSHLANKCRFINSVCNTCHRKGHLAIVCCAGKDFNSVFKNRSSTNFKSKPLAKIVPKSQNFAKNEGVKYLTCTNNTDVSNVLISENNDEDSTYMHSLKVSLPECTKRPERILLNCKMDGVPIEFEFDTGAAVTSISEYEFRKLLPGKEILHTDLQLKTYTGEVICPIGYSTVEIGYECQSAVGNIYILPGNVDPVFGREWLHKFKIVLTNTGQLQMQKISVESQIKKLCEEYSSLFLPSTGKIPNYKGKLILKDNTKPIFKKPRLIPYAIRDRVLQEIDRLEEEGILTKVTYSDWGTPLVPVVKRDGKIRLCADYKCTVNPNLKDDHFPVPNIEEIFATMAGGKYFSSLDLSQAYLSMEMDEESSMIQAVSTPKGVYKVNRLMFGIKIAPAIWQRFMNQLLEGIDGVTVFYDDIKIQGATMEEHMKRLRTVFERLQKSGLRINKQKSQFCKTSITYLGHIINHHGLSKSPEKVEAVIKAPRPKNVTELRSWLGIVNYYGKFLKNLSRKLNPLYKLLQKNVKFQWTNEQEQAFQLIKDEITSDKILVAYNPNLPLLLSTDASPYGIGAVLSHLMPDGSEKPVAYASRSLSAAEKNYSQIDREATGIYWGVLRFFQYLYGRKFTLITDHKPLVSIFSPNKQLPVLSAQRLLHYAQFLQGFNYTLQYRNTKDHNNADALSRLPLQTTDPKKIDEFSQLQINPVTEVPVTHAAIVKETTKDPILRDIYRKLEAGVPLQTPGFVNDIEFSIEEGCILRGSRVVIPTILRKSILNELHSGHLGITKMKALARSYVWWPNIDNDIEKITLNCRSCCLTRNQPSKASIHPWEYPSAPWLRIHIDFAGPFRNKMFLICVDAYSKWPEVIVMNSTTAEKTIEALHEIFSRNGLPVTLVSDNGPQFTSEAFREFMKKNGICHKLIPTYHPSSNGQAERYVATIKNGLRKSMSEPGSISIKLANFLLHYRKTPNATTGVSPCELLMKRNLRTVIDLVRPTLVTTKDFTTNAKKLRQFEVGERVQARNYNDKDVRWKFGKIVRREGSMTYWISVDGQLWKRHVDQLLKCGKLLPDTEITFVPTPTSDTYKNYPTDQPKPNETLQNEDTVTDPPMASNPDIEENSADSESDVSSHSPVQLRRSTRVRKPVIRLDL